MSNKLNNEEIAELKAIAYNLLPSSCGCRQCSYEVQPGHFACSTCDDALLELEEKGIVYRIYEEEAWRWRVVR
jgi:hypothetical protein